jgi:hypothetical protein
MPRNSIGLITVLVISASATAQPSIPNELQHLDPISDAVIAKLVGGDVDARDRTAVQRCASAAMLQASVQYWPKDQDKSDGRRTPVYRSGEGINPAAQMRVTAITSLQHRASGLRVGGLIDGRSGYPLYGSPVGAVGDLNFSCNVDYSGIVSNLHIEEAN